MGKEEKGQDRQGGEDDGGARKGRRKSERTEQTESRGGMVGVGKS